MVGATVTWDLRLIRIHVPSTTGMLNLVDLAGSERLKKSASEGQRKTEALHINSSLTALGKVLWLIRIVSRNRLIEDIAQTMSYVMCRVKCQVQHGADRDNSMIPLLKVSLS